MVDLNKDQRWRTFKTIATLLPKPNWQTLWSDGTKRKITDGTTTFLSRYGRCVLSEKAGSRDETGCRCNDCKLESLQGAKAKANAKAKARHTLVFKQTMQILLHLTTCLF